VGWRRQTVRWFKIVSVWLVPIVYAIVGGVLLYVNANAAVA